MELCFNSSLGRQSQIELRGGCKQENLINIGFLASFFTKHLAFGSLAQGENCSDVSFQLPLT